MDDASKHPARALTRRQREIAALVARGYTNGQIANELVLTSGSVANHVQHILQRLEVSSRAQIAAWAIEHGLSTTQDRLLTTLERLLEIDPTSLVGALRGMAALLAEALAADSVEVFLYDAAADALVGAGTSTTSLARRQAAAGLYHLPITESGHVVETFLTGKPCLTGHAEPASAGSVEGNLGVHSAVYVPLQVGNSRRGVLVATSTTRDMFAERDLRFLLAVAHWVGIVAQRAELVERATASAVEAARAAMVQELVTTLADDLRRRTEPLAKHVELARARAQQIGLRRDLTPAQELVRRVHDLQRLVDDLLAVVRLERGQFELRVVPVDLVALAREAAAPFRSAAQDVRVRAAEGVPVSVDPARVRQALEHLLAEATRRLPDGMSLAAELRTEQRRDGAWGVVTVGTGEPDRWVEPSERLDRFVESADLSISGMGLRLASRIAAAHGGTLATDVTPQGHFRFSLALPAAGPPDAPSQAEGGVPPACRGPGQD